MSTTENEYFDTRNGRRSPQTPTARGGLVLIVSGIVIASAWTANRGREINAAVRCAFLARVAPFLGRVNEGTRCQHRLLHSTRYSIYVLRSSYELS